MDWKQDILFQIRSRDAQVASVVRVVQSYNKLGERVARYADRTSSLEKKTRQLQQDHERLLNDIEKGDGISAIPLAQQRISDLEQEIKVLKDERSELYRTQGVNAQRLLDISDKMRQHDSTISSQNNELTELREELRRRTKKVQDQTDVLREKDNTIQILQDEMTALQLELVQYDKKLDNLKEENDQLVQRWMQKMSTEAEYMNDMNIELRRARRASLLSPSADPRQIELAMFSSSPAKNVSRATWSTHPMAVKSTIDASSSELHSLEISSDGRMLAAGGQEKTVTIYDSVTGETISRLKGCLNSVNHTKFSSDSNLLVAGSSDSSIYTWDLAKMRLKDTLSGHIAKVLKVAISKDSSRIISCSQDRTIKIWNAKKSSCIKTLFTASSCTDMCLQDNSSGTIVASHMDKSVRFWDIISGTSIYELSRLHSETITSISCSEDGRLLLTNSRDGVLKIIDTRTYNTTLTTTAKNYRPAANWSQAQLSPDERYVAGGSTDGTVYFWDLAKGGKTVNSAKVHQNPAAGLCWHPNTTLFYTADVRGRIAVLE